MIQLQLHVSREDKTNNLKSTYIIPPLSNGIYSPVVPKNLDDILYEKFVAFINNTQYIQLNTKGSVRTTELSEEFNNVMHENISNTVKLPQLMGRLMNDYPTMGIIKKVRNYGTIYIGVSLSRLNFKEQKQPSLTQKQKDENRAMKKRIILERYKMEICEETGWTEIQYQQLVNLGLIYLVHNNNILNRTMTLLITKGQLGKYIDSAIVKLKRAERAAKIIMNDYNQTEFQDITLMGYNNYPTYTNRLKSSELTYNAGANLERKINSYINTIGILPVIPDIDYPYIEELTLLVFNLKEHSMSKTRRDMKITQEQYDGEHQQFIDLPIDNILDSHTGECTQFT